MFFHRREKLIAGSPLNRVLFSDNDVQELTVDKHLSTKHLLFQLLKYYNFILGYSIQFNYLIQISLKSVAGQNIYCYSDLLMSFQLLCGV